MPNYTLGSTRVSVEQPDLDGQVLNGSVVLDSRRTRPLWFDGRFLSALDLEREQNYFLQREADLGQAAGFEALQGLMVDQVTVSNLPTDSGTVVIHSGYGVTPAGELVSVPSDVTVRLADLSDDTSLNVQLGLAQAPAKSTQSRSGLYVIALRPVEFTANPITSFPTTIQGPRGTHDGDIVEATAISLVPYPNPPANFPASLQQAAVARQSFVTSSAGKLSDSLLPLAIVSLDRGNITWIDSYIVRRGQSDGVTFGATDPVAQQAFLTQYDAQLQAVVASRQAAGLKANFAASSCFQALPPFGRFPLDAIDANAFTQVFFPQQMDVRLSIVASDELPALLEDGISLPPIDLTLPDQTYAGMAVIAFVPVPRDNFVAIKTSLPAVPLSPTLPQVLANRSPMQLLQLYQGIATIQPVPAVANSAWAAAVGNQQYGFYLRRRSDPTVVQFKTPSGVALSSSNNPSTEGQSVTITAQITPSTATGTVQFFDGGTALGSPAAVTGGAAAFTSSTLAVGAHAITATYGGDAAHLAGNSPALVQTVVKITSATTVKSSVNPSTVGQAVTFTAAVTPASATGTVQFADGASALSSAVPLVGSAASLTTSGLAVGAHHITAAYSGDADTTNSISAPLTQTVNRVTSAMALNSSLNPSVVGQSVTFTATVTPSSATGTVQFSDGSAKLGAAVALTGGIAAVTTSSLSVGAHTIAAAYSGDANDTAVSATVAQTVNKAVAAVAVTASVNPAVVTQPVTFTAHVTPASATGSVQFADGSNPLGSAIALSAGTAVLTTSALAVGTHSITAAYGGDANTLAATSTALTETITKAASTVAATSSLNPSNVTQAVTFTATISPASATGSVQFSDGTAALGSPAAVSGGAATLTTSALSVGAHSITAAYGGDTNTAASTSTPLTQNVNKLNSAVTLNSSLNPSIVGQAVTFGALVSPSSATGSVQFSDGTAPLGSAAPLSGGNAAATTSSLAVGTHTITAAYAGDGNTAAGTSAPLVQTVRQTTSSVTVTVSANPSVVGQAVTFVAAVTPSSATGTAQFFDGATALGSAVSLTGGSAPFTTSALTVGAHTITAAYSGDTNNTKSTSVPLAMTVNQVTTSVSVTSSANPSTVGQAVAFTAHVTPSSATGNVQFSDGGAALGAATPVSTGTAALTASSLAVGTHAITAAYSGDANDTPSTSPPFSQTVDKQASTVALAASATAVTIGQPVTLTATVTPASATGTVQFEDGGNALGAAVALAAGKAALTTSTLGLGSHSITAVYSGDASTAGSTSPVAAVTVTKQTSAVTVTASVNPSTVGQAVVFTATVAPKSATGNLQFMDGTTSLGAPAALNGGVASVSTANLTAGSHSITAVYAGDANTLAGTSAVFTQTVNKQASTVTLTSSVNPSLIGQGVTFTAKISPASATGSVQFQDFLPTGAAPAPIGGAVTVSGGSAAVTTSTLTAGTHSVTAAYSGDANTNSSTSPAVSQVVNRATVTVTLTTAPNPSTVGATVTFTVRVSPANATGTIQLRDGTANMAGPLTLSGGVATLAFQIATAGVHNISAAYSGDATNSPATSNTVAQTVNNIVIQ